MNRYNILIGDKLETERVKEENCHLFQDASEMYQCMLKTNDMWVPVQMDNQIMIYREFDGVMSVKISIEDYFKTKELLPKYIDQLISSREVISFLKRLSLKD